MNAAAHPGNILGLRISIGPTPLKTRLAMKTSCPTGTARMSRRISLTARSAAISWSVETWGGHPDLSFFLDSWHSDFVSPAGEVQSPRNWQRWSSPELDAIIEQVREVEFDDPRGIELGHEFVKLTVEEMPTIPLMSYNVFTMMDETYWTGYPTSADPYTNPVPNWSNSRYMMVGLKPNQPTQ